jgi:outer membrane protein assembly factor BamB
MLKRPDAQKVPVENKGMRNRGIAGALLCVVAVGLYLVSCSSESNSSGQGGCGTPPPPGTTTSVVTTYHNDNARTGQNLNGTTLTTANVNASCFGKLFVISVDGKVDAQPLYLPNLTISGQGAHNLLLVATEHGSVYGFDADTGRQFWQVSTLAAGEMPSDDHGCVQVTPEIGVTSTPVIDASAGAHGTIYVVGMSKDGMGNYHQRLHALDVTTGAEEFGGPKEVQASYPGTGDNS